MTDQPPPPPPPQSPPTYASPAPAGADLTIIKIPILIGAIFNVLSAVGWAWTCVGLVLSVPLGVLAFFEFRLFMKLNDPNYDHASLRKHTQLINILEICTIVALNVGTLVCGVISLVNLNKFDQLPPRPATPAPPPAPM